MVRLLFVIGEQGQRSDENACLPPIWWVELAVGSHLV